MASEEDGSEGKSSGSRKKARYAQKYNIAWESEPEFKGWLRSSSKGQLFEFCSACHVHISVSHGKMVENIQLQRNKQNCTAIAKQPSVLDMPSCSPKRMGILKGFLSFVNVRPHKLLHPNQTRWLSLHMVVVRLLEQYEALKLYFTGAVLDDRLLACENILQR
ncbi:hypothetical protein E2C01_064362 [Portunus trituberculatus]|uniref:Uncharacterized protein n=1 Tax=Portunus trituberculatus TaxID=210409 RepID=A0A5B7HIV3_PORTR|nr:hypothetical protein [Portunus trituberculatus]